MRLAVEGLTRAAMVRAATGRLVVELDDGTRGRLIRWDTERRPGTARVQLHAGHAITVPMRRVRALMLGEE